MCLEGKDSVEARGKHFMSSSCHVPVKAHINTMCVNVNLTDSGTASGTKGSPFLSEKNSETVKK